jgi:hypothetical protein
VSLWRTIRGYWALARFGVRDRYRPGSRYWKWRRDTAFGGPRRLPGREKREAMREFALWSDQMRRFTRKR